MNNIDDILRSKFQTLPEVNKNSKPLNIKWEQSMEFLSYLGIEANRKNTVLLLSISKKFGHEKVLSLRSTLKDSNFDRKKFAGYLVAILKNQNHT